MGFVGVLILIAVAACWTINPALGLFATIAVFFGWVAWKFASGALSLMWRMIRAIFRF